MYACVQLIAILVHIYCKSTCIYYFTEYINGLLAYCLLCIVLIHGKVIPLVRFEDFFCPFIHLN